MGASRRARDTARERRALKTTPTIVVPVFFTRGAATPCAPRTWFLRTSERQQSAPLLADLGCLLHTVARGPSRVVEVEAAEAARRCDAGEARGKEEELTKLKRELAELDAALEEARAGWADATKQNRQLTQALEGVRAT